MRGAQRSLLRLVRHSDVLVENYRAGVMKRLGLGADELRPLPAADLRLDLAATAPPGRGSTVGPTPRWSAPRRGSRKLQGDARGGDYANDPLSHADTYTAVWS